MNPVVTLFTNPFCCRAIALSILLALLQACGGGNSTSQGGLSGTGQEPDPVVVDFPIAYIERLLVLDENDQFIVPTATDRNNFNPGAALFLKERATDGAAAVNITAAVFGEGETAFDIKDLSVHPLGDRLLFAMRAPELEDVDEEGQPKWNIWEYNVPLKSLRRVIQSEIVAEAADDINPRYLADGRIIFTSTRQVRSRAILLDDNKPQYASQSEGDGENGGDSFLLHSMADDGLDIQQLTYNQGQDWNPQLLHDGRVLYTRGDFYRNNRLSFYTMNPDGTEVALHYGYDSLNADRAVNEAEANGALERLWLFSMTQLPDERLVGILKPRNSFLGGDIVALDSLNFTEENAGLDGTVEAESALRPISILPVLIDGEISPHGTFASLTPLYDGTNRLVVSWSQCRLLVPDEDNAEGKLAPCTDELLAMEGAAAATPLYGLWIYNIDDNIQQPIIVPREDVMYPEVVTLEPRAPQNYLIPEPDLELADEGLGVLHIRSVYDMDGVDASPEGIDILRDPNQTTAAARPARFLKIIKAVSLPDEDVLNFPGNAFGASRAEGMKEIIGYVPIEPDGSVKVKLPADMALSFSIVNAQGIRTNTVHRNWLQLRPGEARECQGCHSTDSATHTADSEVVEIPHGRPDAGKPSINAGAVTTGLPFPNTEPSLVADMSETMAEVYARINGVREPTVDLIFEDEWTDPAVREKDPSYAYKYADLSNNPAEMTPPVSEDCQEKWTSRCRILIQYESNIQQIWDKSRAVTNALGDVVADNTCTSCHSAEDADQLIQIPADHLDLTAPAKVNPNDLLASYGELFGGRNEKEIINGVLLDRLVENGQFEVDDDGVFILDVDGNPIPILVTVGLGRVLSPGGALASGRLYSRIATFDPEQDTVDHRNLLNSSELKLLTEWLDIGAQYYNNPFDSVISD